MKQNIANHISNIYKFLFMELFKCFHSYLKDSQTSFQVFIVKQDFGLFGTIFITISFMEYRFLYQFI